MSKMLMDNHMQKTDGFCTHFSHTLSRGRRWVPGLYYGRGWNLGLSPYTDSPKIQISKHRFQLKKLWLHFFGTGQAFSWLTSCLKAKQVLPMHIVRPWDDFKGLLKIKGVECWLTTACSMTKLGPTLYTSPLRCSIVQNGMFSIIHHIAWASRPVIFHLLLHLKKHLAGKKFNNDAEVKEEVQSTGGRLL